jgi:hypothetical protein
LFFPPARGRPARASEASPAQIAATGAHGAGGYGVDPVDGDTGWQRTGGGPREVPVYTREKARTFSIAAYRYNPMARAIIDTYTSFCVGDTGVQVEASNPEVQRHADRFWTDPRNRLGEHQELMFRDGLLNGEQLLELMTGELSGVVRYCPVDTSAITEITNLGGNPLWPEHAHFREDSIPLVGVDDRTGLRTGRALWWAPWKTTLSDTRSQPFLSTVVDWLDSYDTIISNLIDRTALARYIVWDVEVEGTQDDVDAYVKARGGTRIPRSGTVEVHNHKVKWNPKVAQTGAYEDSAAARNVLTLAAAGSGLAKTWLADPEDSNRATSLSMAEPVRRRVQGVQKLWLAHQTELVRYAVDQGVRARRLPALVDSVDSRTGARFQIPAAEAVRVQGPEVAAADAQITAQVLLNLSTGLEKLVEQRLLSREGASLAARRAWESYMGVPYVAELDSGDTDRDEIADHVDSTQVSTAEPGDA